MSEYPPEKKKVTKAEVKRNPRAGLTLRGEAAAHAELQEQLKQLSEQSGDVERGTAAENIKQALGTNDPAVYRKISRQMELSASAIKKSKQAPDRIAEGAAAAVDITVKNIRESRKDTIKIPDPNVEGAYLGRPRYGMPALEIQHPQGVRYDEAPHYPMPVPTEDAEKDFKMPLYKDDDPIVVQQNPVPASTLETEAVVKGRTRKGRRPTTASGVDLDDPYEQQQARGKALVEKELREQAPTPISTEAVVPEAHEARERLREMVLDFSEEFPAIPDTETIDEAAESLHPQERPAPARAVGSDDRERAIRLGTAVGDKEGEEDSDPTNERIAGIVAKPEPFPDFLAVARAAEEAQRNQDQMAKYNTKKNGSPKPEDIFTLEAKAAHEYDLKKGTTTETAPLTAETAKAAMDKLEMDQKIRLERESAPWIVQKLRNAGEHYNKLPKAVKLGITAALFTGAVATSGGAAAALGPWLIGAMVGQRALGGLGMFANIENNFTNIRLGNSENMSWFGKKFAKSEQWRKLATQEGSGRHADAAMLGMLYAIGPAKVLTSAAQWVDETWLGHAAQDWMGEHWKSWFHSGSTVENLKAQVTPTAPESGSLGSIAPKGLGQEFSMIGSKPEADFFHPFGPGSIDATAAFPTVTGGVHGYEGMVQEMYARLHAPGVHYDLPQDHDSDLYKILTADQKTIGAVAHKIAEDHAHNFYHATDSKSVLIEKGSTLGFDDKGNFSFDQAGHGHTVEAAAPDARTTGANVRAEHLAQMRAKYEPQHSGPVVNENDVTKALNENSLAAHHDAVTSIPHETAPATQPEANPMRTAYPDGHIHEAASQPSAPVEHTPLPQHAAPQPEVHQVPQQEAAPVQPIAPANPDIHINANNIPIDMAHTHLYLDAQGNHIAFGGSLQERLQKAMNLVNKDHSSVVYLDSTKPSFLGLITRTELTKVYWDATTNSLQAPNNVLDPSLAGLPLPTADDLYKLADPSN